MKSVYAGVKDKRSLLYCFTPFDLSYNDKYSDDK